MSNEKRNAAQSTSNDSAASDLREFSVSGTLSELSQLPACHQKSVVMVHSDGEGSKQSDHITLGLQSQEEKNSNRLPGSQNIVTQPFSSSLQGPRHAESDIPLATQTGATGTVHHRGSDVSDELPGSDHSSAHPSTARGSLCSQGDDKVEAGPDAKQLIRSRLGDSSASRYAPEEADDLLDPNLLRQHILEYYLETMEVMKSNFREKLHELFFLQNGGNMVDYPTWKKRPNQQLLAFLNASRLDDDMSMSTPTATNMVSPSIQVHAAYSSSHFGTPLTVFNYGTCRLTRDPSDHSQVSTQSKPAWQPSLQGTDPMVQSVMKSPALPQRKSSESAVINEDKVAMQSQLKSGLLAASSAVASSSSQVVVSSVPQKLAWPSSSRDLVTHPQQQTRDFVNGHDDIAVQARREADVLRKVAELRRHGLWTASRLPKVVEPSRKKVHWDYLLEEMQWLATDFAQERRWKRNIARKISRAVMKYHQDKKAKEHRARKEESTKLKRIASSIAKDIKFFWNSVEKVAEYKQQTRLEERRRKALNLHLDFIVDQTEKYSSWLVEGLRTSEKGSSKASSLAGDDAMSEFEPSESGTDDEETIAEEEKDSHKVDYEEEISALQKENELPIEELLKTLPQEMLLQQAPQRESDVEEDIDVEEVDAEDGESSSSAKWGSEDQEFVVDQAASETDEETTIAEQEKTEQMGAVNYAEEIDNLQREGEMPIEDLLELYGTHPEVSPGSNDAASEQNVDSSSEESDESESEDLRCLQSTDSPTDNNDKEPLEKLPDLQLTNAAATAEQLQPKGFTLSTAQVHTAVPFLLHHTLREYQHIGLDWLVTMYEKQLNGILADEMGLGKTIQTIALLAHLACEKEIWGPHLIVVPTSVMLNWEYECKKWCPAFKILTYYGTQKERKQKRQGWSKPNAFHICITSYKLVIQDHQAFRRRKWKYLILDEAQNIKNFKSQRWQGLLNFNSQRRLLLTGTPLQNSLMELWSLMHFLMPHLFSSHQDFKEWFANPLTGMVEGSQEYNEGIVKRLHKVLRPFLLRRLKSEVETQMPSKYEHVIKCRLSKRQRFLYEEFMSRTKTKDTLEKGNFLSIINILMQLRKVCNHPDLFEARPIVSPLHANRITYNTASLVHCVSTRHPLTTLDLQHLNVLLLDAETKLSAFQAHRIQQLKVPRKLIEEIDSPSGLTYKSTDEKQVSSTSFFSPLSNASEREQLLHKFRFTLPQMHGSGIGRRYEDHVMNDEDTALQFLKSISSTLVPENNDIDVVGLDDSEIDEERDNRQSCLLDEYLMEESSPLFISALKDMYVKSRADRLQRMGAVNDRRCDVCPIYGLDLHNAVLAYKGTQSRFIGALRHQLDQSNWSILTTDLKSPEEIVRSLKQIIRRYVFCVPAVQFEPIEMHTFHPPATLIQEMSSFSNDISEALKPKAKFLSEVELETRMQFPETRLIQYDCGKLQTLDALLHQLKSGKHRVLIFTQMTRMLDVLEKFLNYHGHIYLRLDGSTKVEQRQVLMERFNQDSKIFCFILSTRSGGIGVNLTGADTVVFYDSDWNPSMDAQAQDRCHRIGQTRDVHIYRLICDRTVEENILKKANQKRLLGDLAIEGGNFTTASLKESSIKELFNMEAIESAAKDLPAASKEEDKSPPDTALLRIEGDFEKALADAEDDQDVTAAKIAKAEQVAELAEFDEKAPVKDNKQDDEEDDSKVEEELKLLEKELSPIERFALRFVESTEAYLLPDQCFEEKKQTDLAKKDWELEHLQAMKEDKEKRHAAEEDDMFFTYATDGTREQVAECKSSKNNKTARSKQRKQEAGKTNSANAVDVVNVNSAAVDDTASRKQRKGQNNSRCSSADSSRSSSRSSSRTRSRNNSNNSTPMHSPPHYASHQNIKIKSIKLKK